jgi:molybdopterin synthase sulfur carrier subunit
MVKVLFFGEVREQLSCEGLDLSLVDNIRTISDLKQRLRERGDTWCKVFSRTNLVSALNHEIVNESHCLVSNDEVAFFLPVTGG